MPMTRLLVVTFIALLACSGIILSFNGVQGETTVEEDFDLERQLKHLNKPAVKSIKTEYGEIYDCVGFYKQPAFDNPLLKNSTPEIRSLFPSKTLKKASSSSVKHLGLPGRGCPWGTVPIRRTTKEDLKRWKSSSTSSGGYHQFSTRVPPTHFAGFAMADDQSRYHGGSSRMSLHNPSLYSPNQYSGAMMWAQGGQEQVRLGWHVNPKLYGDNKTHLFGYWTTDNSQKTGCYNALCKAWVQVDRKIPIGVAFTVTSTYGGQIYVLSANLSQHKNDGRWWVSITYENITYDIGYWPSELFSSIKESAQLVGWVGEVYASEGERDPPMGTGDFKILPGKSYPDSKTTAFFQDVRVYGEDYVARDPNDASLQAVGDGDEHYFARDFPNTDDNFKHSFFYAGSSP